jgi:nicotinate-nucleotide--dimethylbenzimidazole phosphoribosyltransferase
VAKALEERLSGIREQDAAWRAKAHARLEQLTMPYWALGRLMDLAEDLAGMTRSMNPPVARKTIVTMAGDHGVVAEGVSKYPQVVTLQMVHNFVTGGAGINALARVVGARVLVVDMGAAGDLKEMADSGKILSRRIGPGTQNIARGPAMTRADAVRCIESGMELALQLGESTDVFGTGDMGIGNTTPSAAIASAITGCTPLAATGRGTGIDSDQLRHKVSVVERALEVNKPDPTDGLDVLAKVGGFEIGGIAGLILGAACLRKPVIVDGFISTAGALIAQTLSAEAADYMIAAHRSDESGHAIMLQHLKKMPLLDLGLRLGEGTGGALAMNLVDAAAAILTRVSTFDEASVSKANA